MIGVGPFITTPLIVAAMGGPQAMIGWVVGAVLVICDGLVWAELGAAFPGTGGTYRYLGEIYGRGRLGRPMSFLFIWQLTFSAPLSIASGLWHFDPALAFDFPEGGFTLRPEFFYGLGSALLIAAGLALYLLRARVRREWPFAKEV